MTREYRKTEKRLRATFWAEIAPGILPNDKPALRCAFNNWLDSLERDGELTEHQASRITLGPDAPKPRKPARHDTAAKLRRALADLLADVTDGTVKNGGNPWSLESVKAASEALTGDRFGFSSASVKGQKA